MSFGSEDLPIELRDAINEAKSHNVILLASAGNFGNLRPISYPAKKIGVFKIFAADRLGNPAGFSPPPDDDTAHCFFLLGCRIMSTWPSNLRTQTETELDVFCWDSQKRQPRSVCPHPKIECDWRTVMSGTSFATPIAAAVVAIIYQFYNVNQDRINLRDGSEKNFKTPEAVQAILTHMSRLVSTERFKFVEPIRGRDDRFQFKFNEKASEKGGDALNRDLQTPIEFFSKRLTEILEDEYI